MKSSPREPFAGMCIVRTFAGVQAGILTGMVALFWFLLVTFLTQESMWVCFNVFSSIFNHRNMFRTDFGFHTCSGIAVHLLWSGFLGVLLAWMIPASCKWMRSVLLTAIYIFLMQIFLQRVILDHLNPWVNLYLSPLLLLTANSLLVVGISTIPFLIRSMRSDFLLK